MIEEERLKPAETREFFADSFRDGGVAQQGTATAKILPPTSRFAKGDNSRGEK